MIINSLLDTDLYKFTMQQIVFHMFPDVDVEYEFRIRNYPASEITGKMKDRIEKEIDCLCTLKFRREELEYLESIPFLSKGYVHFLKNFQLDKDDIIMGFINRDFKLLIQGTWLNTILFEVPVLAIISHIFTDNKCHFHPDPYARLFEKIKKVENIRFADFGTRRRYCKEYQDIMVNILKENLPNNFIGTSNVWLARKHKVKPIGTMAHEYIQAMQAFVKLKNSQKYALQCWAEEYRGRLGIALSDTLGIDTFLNDFDLYFAKLFDGVRQDSGDPFIVARKIIDHYRTLGIDPRFKTIVFSDGLTIQKAETLHTRFSDDIKCSFGIGTHLTNDVSNFKAPQIVIKMTKCDGQPVAKISDSKGKQMCNDQNYLKYLASVFNIKREDIYE